jgi:hypothetical protein
VVDLKGMGFSRALVILPISSYCMERVDGNL